MADENDSGASYLASLRHVPASGAGAAAPAPAPELPLANRPQSSAIIPSVMSSSASTEKRRSPRYKCAGSARMQQIGDAAPTWATLADISMHGCYVETAAPLHKGAVVELRLEANDLRIESKGEVRVVYPGLGMGISFSGMSDENRERLRELLRPVSRPSVILSSLSQEAHAHRPASHSVPPAVANPSAAVQAIVKFFEDRHVMGREEFLRILRTSQL